MVLGLVVSYAVVAQVVIMPGLDEAALQEAARRAGLSTVPAIVVQESLALLADEGCGLGEARCLARLANIAEARLSVVGLGGPAHIPDRRDALVVSAAGERRRVQSSHAAFIDDVAQALVPPARAQLRVSVDVDLGGVTGRDIAAVDVDDSAIVAGADGVFVAGLAPGTHRARVSVGEYRATALVELGVGESLWLHVADADFADASVAQDLAPTTPAPTVTGPDANVLAKMKASAPHGEQLLSAPETGGFASGPAQTAIVGGIGVAAVGLIVGTGGAVAAAGAIAEAEASTVQRSRQDAADAANTWLAVSGIGLALSVAGMVGVGAALLFSSTPSDDARRGDSP